jgi:S-layer protein (TIGR01567 family)
MKQILAVLMIALLMIAPISAERITEDVEIRGTVAVGDFDYDYASFAGFWYDLKKDLSSETLNVTVSGRDATVVYQCDPKIQNYKNPALGNYTILGLFASKYVCYDDEDVTLAKTDKLVKLLVNEKGSKDHNVAMGELVTMPENFAVAVTQIDLGGDKAIIVLYKDGIALDTEVCTAGDTYTYMDDEDVMIFSCRVSQVFRGTDTNMCTLNYIWLLSDDVLEISTDDSFGEMEVTSTSNGITMKSDGTINLGQDDEVDLMKGLYFKVADSTSLRYYLAKKVVLECPECPAVVEPAPCPEQEPCEPCPTVTPEIIVKYVNVTTPAEPVNEAPGFGAILPLMGLLIVAYFVVRQKE